MFWLFALPLLIADVQVAGVNTGLKVQVTQKGLEYGGQFVVELLKSVLMKEKIQDINGSYQVPLVGNAQYSVWGLHVSQIQEHNSTVGFAEGTGVSLGIRDAQVLLKGHWRLTTSLGSDSGTADIRIRQLFLSTVLGVDRGSGGRLRVWCAGCHSAIGDLDLTFYGGSSWLYNLFASSFKGSLQSEVNKQLCPELRKGIDDLARVLRTANVSAKMDSFAEMDYSVVNKPVISADQFNMDLKGQFFRVGQPHTSPLVPAPFLLPDQPGSMLLLGISEFFANSAALVYFTSGALRVNYTDKTIPKSIPFRLNTKSLGLFLPELKQQFPDMAMEIHITARKQPLLNFHPGGVDAAVFGAAEAFVVLPSARLASVFLLNIDANLTGQVLLEPVKSGKSIGRVGGSVALKRFRLSQDRSSIGEIKVKFLEKVLYVALQLASSRVNKRLKKGVALPNIYNATLVNPQVAMYQGFMLIATDLHYHPQVAA
ncbi:bactericidal permeability-increasing protein-like [Hemicordylus capensis]|uniref:bactericidal permeability-increasing protein-like n=1 Tax=Hemicordylus capensis TaxID=884348 RepID=UPI002303B70E|nr:bactericidal permeability-increasing protein-like [Hemicordylus capensis]